MTPLTKRLAEMRKICDAATDGPWDVSQYTNYSGYSVNSKHGCIAERWPANQELGDNEKWGDIGHFIAESRTMMPRLIEALELARQDLQSIANIDKGKMKNLAQASLDEIEYILKGEE